MEYVRNVLNNPSLSRFDISQNIPLHSSQHSITPFPYADLDSSKPARLHRSSSSLLFSFLVCFILPDAYLTMRTSRDFSYSLLS